MMMSEEIYKKLIFADKLTTTFMLPLVDNVNLYNEAYMLDENITLLTNNPCILQGVPDSELEQYKNNSAVLGIYKIFIPYVPYNYIAILEINNLFYNDYQRFVKGKYSEFSDKAKEKIIKKWAEYTEVNSTIVQRLKKIFTKDKSIQALIKLQQSAEQNKGLTNYTVNTIGDFEICPVPQNETIKLRTNEPVH